MNIVSFELSVSSQNSALLEEFRNITCPNAVILNSGGMSKLCALLTKTSDYKTDTIIYNLVNTIKKISAYSSNETEDKIQYMVNVGIIVSDANETSIPGIVFPSEYIHLASKLKILTHFHLMITSSTMKGQLNSGAYFYIQSDNEIDLQSLNKITDTEPSIVYQRGSMGRYTVVNFNAWGIEVSYDDQLPNIPISALMSRLHNYKAIGLYCKEKNMESHIDLTCYGINSDPIDFEIDHSFFSFAEELSAQYVDIDFMN